MSRRTKILLVVAAVVVVAAVAGSAVALTTGKSGEKTLNHREYAVLFATAALHKTKIDFIDQWPKPYQTYHDSYQHQCYEWWDKPRVLYSLCFMNGTLVNKDIL
jgi:hypothetical protein